MSTGIACAQRPPKKPNRLLKRPMPMDDARGPLPWAWLARRLPSLRKSEPLASTLSGRRPGTKSQSETGQLKLKV